MRPLRICIFTETYYPVVGGGETQSQLLGEGLAVLGHSVLVVTRRSHPALPGYEKVGSVDVYRIPPVGKGRLKKWGLLLTSLPALIKLRSRFDVIFVSGFRLLGIPAVLVSRLFNKRCILKADSQGEMSGDYFTNGLIKFGLTRAFLPFRLFFWLRNQILRKADMFTAITAEIAGEYAAGGIQPEKVQIIPNSVDTDRFSPVSGRQKLMLRNQLGLPPDGMIVIYTGRLVSYKGLPLLARVWKEIRLRHSGARLILAGEGGLDMHNCEASLRAYVKANAMGQDVIFTGSVRNVHEYLQASDVFVFPTENDAFPSSVIEAMACGLAVITTPVGAMKTILNDEQNGLVVQPGDFQQLYHALDRLLSDAELASCLGGAALGTVQAAYSAKVVTRQYSDLFLDKRYTIE